MKPDPDHKPRHIAPRLRSGLRRVNFGGALPPHIKHAIQMIAAARGESASWLMEQTLYAHFGLKPPQYVGTRGPDLDMEIPSTVKLKYPRSA